MQTTLFQTDKTRDVQSHTQTSDSLLLIAHLDELRELSTCLTASAIETFSLRPFNAGFADSSIRCQFKELPPVVGYAATAHVRSARLPIDRHGYSYYDRTHWWKQILTIFAPRIVVIEDLDEPAGLGAFVGAVHAHILQALGCVALVTNGSVRDIAEIHETGFQLFASNVAVSHAYSHVIDFGSTVCVGGLEIAPGDLVHGDLHGVQTIPLEIADKVPAVAREILKRRKRLMDLCRSNDFSVEKLEQLIKQEEGSKV
jgi:4-hydroxy-4-methyl-2-oxoglutarate aldolase